MYGFHTIVELALFVNVIVHNSHLFNEETTGIAPPIVDTLLSLINTHIEDAGINPTLFIIIPVPQQ